MQSSCSIGNSTLVQWVLIFLFVVVCFGFRKKFLIVDSINTMERSLGKGGGGGGGGGGGTEVWVIFLLLL